MTIIYFLLILTIIVSIHEFGHFLFAKKAGIYVYEFSIGMGPRIFKFKRKNDETEYSIRLLPIGGYVQMYGEGAEEDKNIPKEKNMQNKTWLQRFLVIIAGIMFNFILSIIMLFIVGLCTNNPHQTMYVETGNEVLLKDDKIISLNGKRIRNYDKFQLEYQVAYGKDIEFKIIRNNEEKTVKVTPKEVKDKKGNVSYQYGFSLKVEHKKGILEAIKYAFTSFVNLIVQMFSIICYLVTGKLNLSSLSGPVGIYSVVDASAKAGFINILYLIGYLSLNVGFMNLLPIPALDGGRLIFLIIEKIIGHPLNQKYENMIHSIGFILLMLLIVVVSYNDIIRLIGG